MNQLLISIYSFFIFVSLVFFIINLQFKPICSSNTTSSPHLFILFFVHGGCNLFYYHRIDYQIEPVTSKSRSRTQPIEHAQNTKTIKPTHNYPLQNRQIKVKIQNKIYKGYSKHMDPTKQHIQPTPAKSSVVHEQKVPFKHTNNIIFAVCVLLYEALALPIYGVLFRLSGSFEVKQDYGGVLLISIATILLIIGFGLINTYIVRSSFTGMTYTLVIFALTIQHFFLFRAFWNKAGANDYNNSSKTWNSYYDVVTISNYGVDRQTTTLLPSGAFVQAIAMAISLAVAFNSLVGRIGLLELFMLTFFGAFFYEVNAQLIYRWFITDNGFGCRIFLFGSVLGTIITLLLGKKQTTVGHTSYRSQYRMMAFGLLGFLFVVVTMPILSGISIFSRTSIDNAVLYASQINAWLAVFASVLGTFTASAFLYRKFSVHDLVFVGTAGAVSLAMEADINFNPCVPLIVGYVVGFICSLYPASLNRNVNKNGVIFSFATINRFLLPSVLACIVSAIIQACAVSANGLHILNKLPQRTPIQQGGWQLVGLLITTGIALLAGLIIGILCKIINKFTYEEQFNDQVTYNNIPSPAIGTD